jgi:hypothetical protein
MTNPKRILFVSMTLALIGVSGIAMAASAEARFVNDTGVPASGLVVTRQFVDASAGAIQTVVVPQPSNFVDNGCNGSTCSATLTFSPAIAPGQTVTYEVFSSLPASDEPSTVTAEWLAADGGVLETFQTPVQPIPAVPPWGIALLGLMTMGAGSITRKRGAPGVNRLLPL